MAPGAAFRSSDPKPILPIDQRSRSADDFSMATAWWRCPGILDRRRRSITHHRP
ncbi:MAG: hypothetical protein ACKOZT_09000 [Cyanobium sp.]